MVSSPQTGCSWRSAAQPAAEPKCWTDAVLDRLLMVCLERTSGPP